MKDRSLKVVVLYDAGADANFNRPGEIPPAEDIRPVAEEVERCLLSLGHRTAVIPALPPIERTAENVRLQKPDVVFNLCEAFSADSDLEGDVAGLLEMMNIPYTGNAPPTLHLSLRKERVKEILRANGVPTPKWFTASTPFFAWKRQVPLPAIVKPLSEDASVGIESESVVRSVREMRARVEHILTKHKQDALVEEYIEGREINVAMVGGRVLEISEIDFSGLPRSLPKIVSYRGKWNEKSDEFRGTVPICPARLTRRKRREAEELALKVWKILDGQDYGRLDMRLRRSDGRFFVLEFNPNPDLSRDAGIANCARAAGWDYRRLVGEIVSLAAKRIPPKNEVQQTQSATQVRG